MSASDRRPWTARSLLFVPGDPMRRFGRVEEAADAVCFLAAPTGRFVIGEVLAVDGGYRLWGDQWTIPRPGCFDVAGSPGHG